MGKVAVVVLGMHRSGTSALTRVLNALGCGLPATVMHGGDDNETGHWESVPVMNLNEALLNSAGTHWADIGAVHEGWFQSPVAPHFILKAAETLTAEYGDQPLIVLKDPRICKIWPAWDAALRQCDYQPHVVLQIRHPLEVAHSLNRRNSLSIEYALLLWMSHVLDAEFFSRGQPRVVTSFEALLSDWSGLVARAGQGLALHWPQSIESARYDAEAYLRQDMRHHVVGNEHALTGPAHRMLMETYAIMQRWADAGEDLVDYPLLDSAREALRAGEDLFLPALREQQRVVQDIQARLADREQAIFQLDATVEEQTAKLTILAERHHHACFERDEQVALAAQLAETVERQQGESTSREQSLSDACARIGFLESQLEQRGEENRQAWAQLDSTQSEVDALRQDLASVNAALGTLAGRLEASDQWVFRLAGERQAQDLAAKVAQSRLAANERALTEANARADRAIRESLSHPELAEVTAALHAAEQARDALRDELSLEREEAATAKAAVAEMKLHIDHLDHHARGLAHERHESDQRMRQSQREVVHLTRMLQEQAQAADHASESADWLQQVHLTLARAPFWWRLLPRRQRQEREQRLVAAKSLFDPEIYLRLHPDVRNEGINPLVHYIRHGMAEGRRRNH